MVYSLRIGMLHRRKRGLEGAPIRKLQSREGVTKHFPIRKLLHGSLRIRRLLIGMHRMSIEKHWFFNVFFIWERQ